MTNYQPIECGLHSKYELAIMHGQSIWLRWKDSNNKNCEDKLLPLDLVAQNHEEFLIAKTSNNDKVQIRLDKIIYMEVLKKEN